MKHTPKRGESEIFARDAVDESIAVVDGYGVRLSVERGQLVIVDGVGPHRRTRHYSRAQRDLRRILILGHVGSLSLEVLAWCADVGVALTVMDRDGRHLASTPARGPDDARLRRAQALAAGSEVGLGIARELISAKIAGQQAVALQLDADIADLLDGSIVTAQDAQDHQSLRDVEATAAVSYWHAWRGSTVRFATADAKRVPDHWASGFTARTTGVASSKNVRVARRATHPVCAIQNYAYALAEAECRYACWALGLDPALGFLHTDEQGRDSLTLDLLEAIRPDVDRVVLDLIATRTFRRSDFTETRDGVCRLTPPLTHILAAQTAVFAQAIAPWVEAVAHTLAEHDGRISRRTPLTGRQHRQAAQRGGRRSHPTTEPLSRRSPAPELRRTRFARTCAVCGADLPTRGRKHCDACAPAARERARAAFAASSAEAARRRKALGEPHPQHGVEARAKRRATNRAIALAQQAWERDNPDAPRDAATFQKTILPGLQQVTIRRMVETAQISPGHASQVRRGLAVPHPRLWQALAKLVEAPDA
jgi:CRISPR-associated protein Cas1